MMLVAADNQSTKAFVKLLYITPISNFQSLDLEIGFFLFLGSTTTDPT
jgi:hypothetical protein